MHRHRPADDFFLILAEIIWELIEVSVTGERRPEHRQARGDVPRRVDRRVPAVADPGPGLVLYDVDRLFDVGIIGADVQVVVAGGHRIGGRDEQIDRRAVPAVDAHVGDEVRRRTGEVRLDVLRAVARPGVVHHGRNVDVVATDHRLGIGVRLRDDEVRGSGCVDAEAPVYRLVARADGVLVAADVVDPCGNVERSGLRLARVQREVGNRPVDGVPVGVLDDGIVLRVRHVHRDVVLAVRVAGVFDGRLDVEPVSGGRRTGHRTAGDREVLVVTDRDVGLVARTHAVRVGRGRDDRGVEVLALVRRRDVERRRVHRAVVRREEDVVLGLDEPPVEPELEVTRRIEVPDVVDLRGHFLVGRRRDVAGGAYIDRHVGRVRGDLHRVVDGLVHRVDLDPVGPVRVEDTGLDVVPERDRRYLTAGDRHPSLDVLRAHVLPPAGRLLVDGHRDVPVACEPAGVLDVGRDGQCRVRRIRIGEVRVVDDERRVPDVTEREIDHERVTGARNDGGTLRIEVVVGVLVPGRREPAPGQFHRDLFEVRRVAGTVDRGGRSRVELTGSLVDEQGPGQVLVEPLRPRPVQLGFHSTAHLPLDVGHRELEATVPVVDLRRRDHRRSTVGVAAPDATGLVSDELTVTVLVGERRDVDITGRTRVFAVGRQVDRRRVQHLRVALHSVRERERRRSITARLQCRQPVREILHRLLSHFHVVLLSNLVGRAPAQGDHQESADDRDSEEEDHCYRI